MDSKGESEYQAFPATRWSLVIRSGARASEEGFRALEQLVTCYRPALKTYLVYVKKLDPEQADDLIQGFLADKVLQSGLLALAEREKGRFRTYLLTALERYRVSVYRKETAGKRSPGAGMMANLDEIQEIVADPHAGSDTFDIAWARELIQRTLQQVRTELESSDRAAFWAIFAARIVEPILDGALPAAYEKLVGRLGFASPMQASNALITAKRMFVRKLREAVADYVVGEQQIDAELADLQAILAGAGAGGGP